ncbi:MAG: hypothetical protein N2506_04425 [Dehalococcoidales bacterium]|nr:hypothetical protein [Dehalococcoidales bacterium]
MVNRMVSIEYFLFSILLLLGLGAVIAFMQLVVRPLRTYWAIAEARRMIASGKTCGSLRYQTVLRTLATAGNDLEAATLWKKLKELEG